MSQLKPKLFTTMKNYSTELFLKDLTAGIIVAIIALPLSIALGIASGVTPEQGLHTAIIAGFIISFLGGSRVQIGGPTGAFMVIVFGIVSQYGVDGLIISTIMAGLMMIGMGLLRFGAVIKFIPYPITTGFTSGIAVVIFSSQVKDFLGLDMKVIPSEFVEKWHAYFGAMHTLSIPSLFIGMLSLLIIIYWPKVTKKIPGSLIALIVATLVVQLFHLDVQTIGSKFGELSSALPMPHLPNVTPERLRMLIEPAISIAILGAIESLLSAVVADGMIGDKHRSDMELIAQGTANVASGIFGGIPATGAIARTAANIRNGANSPVAGMVHAVVLLLIMVLFMPLAKMIPLSALAAILIIVAYNMSEWREFIALLNSPKSDVTVLIVTFLLTVLIDLVVAIEVGMVLAAMLFMKRMSDVSSVESLVSDAAETDENSSKDYFTFSKDLPEGVQVFEINGPFFFGAADRFLDVVSETHDMAKVFIVRMRYVPAMDATAVNALKRFNSQCIKRHAILVLSEINEQPLNVIQKSDLFESIGAKRIFEDYEAALQYATEISMLY